MSKQENNFKDFVDYINNLDDKDWYTWYLDKDLRTVSYEFLEHYTHLVMVDYSRGIVWTSIHDFVDEKCIKETVCQDITTCIKNVIKTYNLIGNGNRQNKCRTKEVTKTQLEDLGIVFVSEDGDVYAYNGDVVYKKIPFEVVAKRKYSTNKKRYLYLDFYNPLTSKNIRIALHRIVYAWFNGVAHEGMTIDHIDNNELNNNIHNLRELSLEENLSRKTVGRNQYNWYLSDEEILSRRYERKYNNK